MRVRFQPDQAHAAGRLHPLPLTAHRAAAISHATRSQMRGKFKSTPSRSPHPVFVNKVQIECPRGVHRPSWVRALPRKSALLGRIATCQHYRTPRGINRWRAQNREGDGVSAPWGSSPPRGVSCRTGGSPGASGRWVSNTVGVDQGASGKKEEAAHRGRTPADVPRRAQPVLQYRCISQHLCEQV